MGKTFRSRCRSADGFTLTEVLIIILIIGILAAIALPAFLGQRTKGQDASAMADARNAVSELESCFADTQDYGDPECSAVLDDARLPATVTFTSADEKSFVVTSTSASTNVFQIAKEDGGPGLFSCVSNVDSGGCAGTSW